MAKPDSSESDYEIIDCRIFGASCPAISLSGNNSLIRNNYITGVATNLININGNNNIISDNVIVNLSTTAGAAGRCIFLNSGASGNKILDNYMQFSVAGTGSNRYGIYNPYAAATKNIYRGNIVNLAQAANWAPAVGYAINSIGTYCKANGNSLDTNGFTGNQGAFVCSGTGSVNSGNYI
jgi:hypothetical protein